MKISLDSVKIDMISSFFLSIEASVDQICTGYTPHWRVFQSIRGMAQLRQLRRRASDENWREVVGSDWARFIRRRRDHKSQLKKVDARANLKRLSFSAFVFYTFVFQTKAQSSAR